MKKKTMNLVYENINIINRMNRLIKITFYL